VKSCSIWSRRASCRRSTGNCRRAPAKPRRSPHDSGVEYRGSCFWNSRIRIPSFGANYPLLSARGRRWSQRGGLFLRLPAAHPVHFSRTAENLSACPEAEKVSRFTLASGTVKHVGATRENNLACAEVLERTGLSLGRRCPQRLPPPKKKPPKRRKKNPRWLLSAGPHRFNTVTDETSASALVSHINEGRRRAFLVPVMRFCRFYFPSYVSGHGCLEPGPNVNSKLPLYVDSVDLPSIRGARTQELAKQIPSWWAKSSAGNLDRRQSDAAELPLSACPQVGQGSMRLIVRVYEV